MENQLKELLKEKALKKLGIPICCLPLHTGMLPRKNGQIQEEFSHLPSLKRLYIEKALCHLYSHIQLDHRIKVVIFTWVIGDGLGDYSAQIETARILCKELPPSSEITLISIHPVRMPLLRVELDCKQFFMPYEEMPGDKIDAIPEVLFSEEIMSTLCSASVILQIPTYFPQTRELLDEILFKRGPSYELIGEGGWGATPRFTPTSGSRSLGLRFFEKGLFFPDFFPDFTPNSSLSLFQEREFEGTIKKINSLEDIRLQKALLEGRGFGKIYMAYLREFSSARLFLETVLKQNKEDLEDLSLCVFPSEELIRSLPVLTDLCKTCGVGCVKIFYEESFLEMPLKESGKTLKIIQVKKSSRSDYQILLKLSDSLVGCRGDGSLSETLSAGKIPFLDFPAHKKPLLEGLVEVSAYLLTEHHCVTKYLKEFLLSSPNSERLGLLAKEPILIEGFNALSLFLKENYSVDDFIKNLTKRAACHHFYPQMAILEKVHMDSFLFGEKSAYEALLNVKIELQQLVLS